MDELTLELSTDLSETTSKELSPLTVIRTETALSRFPVHRIAKKGNVKIELKNQAAAHLWRVSHNSEFGQPGPLAYKLDSLVVSRRIEEAGRPIPSIIRLGSLRDIALEVEAGEKNTQTVKQALLQNAFAAITAKITYKGADKIEHTLEAAFTRYSLVFTGEKLPNGKVADAVYLVLNEIYLKVLNAAVTRPLDYDYMKSLPPAAQRFYEIVSYQIYAALLHENDRAKLRYSEYCLLSTATRYPDFDHVKKQMYKIHLPHLRSGYLSRVSYEATTDEAGQPDWFMWYIPGVNAAREYQEFNQAGRRNRRAKKEEAEKESNATLALPFAEEKRNTHPELNDSSEERKDQITNATLILTADLVAAGLNRATAERFAQEKPEECRIQLSYLPYVSEFKSSKGAYLRRAIEQGFAPPMALQKQQAHEEAEKRKAEEDAKRNARKVAQEARRAAELSKVAQELGQLEREASEAYLDFLSYETKEREQYEAKYVHLAPTIQKRMREAFDHQTKRHERFIAWKSLEHIEEDDPEAIRKLLVSQFTEAEVKMPD